LEVVAELGRYLAKALRDDPHLDLRSVLQSQIEMYTQFLEVYTRERYPYQWALIQKELGEVYAQRGDRGYTNDYELAIECDEAALQVITRNVSRKSWDLTKNNKIWADTHNQLGLLYALRRSGDRLSNITHAAECHKAALLVWTLEENLYAHRDIQLDLAFLYCRDWAVEASQRGNISDVLVAYHLAHEAFITAR